MSTRTACSLAQLPSRLARPAHYSGRPSVQRSFITFPSSTQRLTAVRAMPYAASRLYELIADVDSYSTFVPYCSQSRITHWTAPDPSHGGRRLPCRADMHVGWGGFDECFTSELRCVPGLSVEARSGKDAVFGSDAPQSSSSVFDALRTKWSLRPLNETSSAPETEVSLAIEYQFSNPLYAAVSSAVSDKIAGIMIEAFEKQALTKLGQPAS